jgi:ABC-type amino acid transport substrate-binding protein
MLATGIPTATGGIRVAIGRELVKAGLPLDLLGLVDVNGNWIYRVEKTLSLLGIALVVVFAVCGVAGRLRRRTGWLATMATTVGVLAVGLVAGGRASLARSLGGTYANDRMLLALGSAVQGPEPTEIDPGDTRAKPVDFASIRKRRVLRVGVREGAIPWSHRGSNGRIVGYDVDVAKALAADLGLSLEVVPASLPELERLLGDGHVDLAVGGIQPTTDRDLHLQASRAYQPVHMALVVHDEMVRDVQQLATRPLGRPLLIGIPSGDPTSAELEKRIERALGVKGAAVPVDFAALDRAEDFFAPADGSEEAPDALLTTAEGGAACAVVHPETTMVTVFGAELPSELVMLAGGSDRSTLEVVDRWIERRDRKGLFRRLFRHWVEVRGDDVP